MASTTIPDNVEKLNAVSQEIADISQNSPDPHPAPEAIVTELRREPERYINEIVWLKAMNPAVDGQPTQRLMVVLSRKDEDSDVLVDLNTNDIGLFFVIQVIRQHFSYAYSIFESWLAPEPF